MDKLAATIIRTPLSTASHGLSLQADITLNTAANAATHTDAVAAVSILSPLVPDRTPFGVQFGRFGLHVWSKNLCENPCKK